MVCAFQNISLSMVKNEQDIIEPFVRHNLKFLDFMVIADNGSVDNTRSILIELAKETGKILVLDHLTFEHTQSLFMTKLLHMVQSTFFAEYITFLDADEFVQAPNRASFEKVISGIPTGFYGRIPWVSHVLPQDQSLAELKSDPPASIKWRRKFEHEQHCKAVLRLGGAIGKELQVSMGNHQIETLEGEKIGSVNLRGVSLLHFPVRSEEQLITKSVNGWIAVLAKEAKGISLGRNEAHQWRENFERALIPGEIKRTISEASFNYGQRPKKVDWNEDVIASDHRIVYERKYSDGSFANPMTMLARSWEGSLKKRKPTFSPNGAGRGVVSDPTPSTVDGHVRAKNLYADVAPFRVVSEMVEPQSVLEVGCGIGTYSKLLAEMGAVRVLGVGNLPLQETLLNEAQYSQGNIAAIQAVKTKFDLVVCTEALSQLNEKVALNLLSVMARNATKSIMFSAASAGQPGSGNVNYQPLSYWLVKWREKGWAPDLSLTLSVRAAATFSWFRHNLVVLKPIEVADDISVAIECLTAIATKPFRWYSDKPGIREHILETDMQPFLEAYIQEH